MNELSQADKDFLDPFLPTAVDVAASAGTQNPHDRPFVTLTYASSLDSMIALAPGVRTTLSGPETKCMTHYLRLHHDAILVGVGTATTDDPALNCRYPGATLHEQPQPVILDPTARWQPQKRKVVQLASERQGKAPWIFTNEPSHRAEVLHQVGGEYVLLSRDDRAVASREDTALSSSLSMSWAVILSTLKANGIKSVMIEGGATVINTLLAMPEFVDCVIITVAPTWLGVGGVQAAPAARSTDGQRVNAAWLRKASWRQFGHDAVLCGRLHDS